MLCYAFLSKPIPKKQIDDGYNDINENQYKDNINTSKTNANRKRMCSSINKFEYPKAIQIIATNMSVIQLYENNKEEIGYTNAPNHSLDYYVDFIIPNHEEDYCYKHK